MVQFALPKNSRVKRGKTCPQKAQPICANLISIAGRLMMVKTHALIPFRGYGYLWPDGFGCVD